MAETQDGKLNLDQGGEWLMVTRQSLESETVILDEAEYSMLFGLSQNKTLGEAAQGALDIDPDFDFQGFLQKHLTLETFQAFRPNM